MAALTSHLLGGHELGETPGDERVVVSEVDEAGAVVARDHPEGSVLDEGDAAAIGESRGSKAAASVSMALTVPVSIEQT